MKKADARLTAAPRARETHVHVGERETSVSSNYFSATAGRITAERRDARLRPSNPCTRGDKCTRRIVTTPIPREINCGRTNKKEEKSRKQQMKRAQLTSACSRGCRLRPLLLINVPLHTRFSSGTRRAARNKYFHLARLAGRVIIGESYTIPRGVQSGSPKARANARAPSEVEANSGRFKHEVVRGTGALEESSK